MLFFYFFRHFSTKLDKGVCFNRVTFCILNVKGGFSLELDSYELNFETLLIVPYGKGKSKVFEFDGEFIVKMSPLNIIKNSCLYFGSSYEGRKEGTKSLIGVDMKVPIVIEDSRNIIFFPTSSCVNISSIWISYQNLLKYSKVNEFSTMLYFKNNKHLKVDIRYNLIDNQVIRCIKLESLLIKRKKFIKNEISIMENFE